MDECDAANIKQAYKHLSNAFGYVNAENVRKHDAINEIARALLIINGMIQLWEIEQ